MQIYYCFLTLSCENEDMKSGQILIGVITLLIVGAVFYFAFARGEAGQPQTPTPNPTEMIDQIIDQTTENNDVKVFNITGKPFAFTPNEIRVKKGDKVRINFSNELGFHDLTIPELNLKTTQIQAGQSDGFEFSADKAGTFEFFCSVPTHKDQGMVGTLIVEE